MDMKAGPISGEADFQLFLRTHGTAILTAALSGDFLIL
jgi:hypothetical protein